VIDPAGNWKQYASDALGNLVTVLEPDPLANPVPGPPGTPPAYPVTAAPTGMLLTSYTYDQVNHLTQVAMPRNTANGMKTQTRTFVYDSTTQRLTSATNPENGTVSYTYNADGTLATKTDASGFTESYTYDAYQRLTAIPDRQQTFTYDTCPTTNATGCVNAPGQMVQATFGSNIGPNWLNFAYNCAYTPAGKVSSKTLAVQSANHFTYSFQYASGAVAASYAYDSQGALTQMSYTPACIQKYFKKFLASRGGQTCSNPMIIGPPNNTDWSSLSGQRNDAFYDLDLWMNSAGVPNNQMPSASSSTTPTPSVTHTIHYWL